LNTDARHRVTLSALYKAPLGLNLSGIMRYHSGTPFTAWNGVGDKNQQCGPGVFNCDDGYAMDLAPGVSHVNSLRGGSFSQRALPGRPSRFRNTPHPPHVEARAPGGLSGRARLRPLTAHVEVC